MNTSKLMVLILVLKIGNIVAGYDYKLRQVPNGLVTKLVRESRTVWRGSDDWKQKLKKPGDKVETLGDDVKHTMTHEADGRIKVVSKLGDKIDLPDIYGILGDNYLIREQNRKYLATLLADLVADKDLPYNRKISDEFTKCRYTKLELGERFLLGNSVISVEIECTTSFEKELFLKLVVNQG